MVLDRICCAFRPNFALLPSRRWRLLAAAPSACVCDPLTCSATAFVACAGSLRLMRGGRVTPTLLRGYATSLDFANGLNPDALSASNPHQLSNLVGGARVASTDGSLLMVR